MNPNMDCVHDGEDVRIGGDLIFIGRRWPLLICLLSDPVDWSLVASVQWLGENQGG